MNVRHIPGSAGLVGLFARHRNAANLLMVLMIIFGVFSLGRINTQFFPNVEIKSIWVTVAWPGASAEDVEANVLRIIEPEIRFVDGAKKIVSYAREGSGSVNLEFRPDTDMKKATADVDSAVKAINNLPEDSETPKVSQSNWFDRIARLAIIGDIPEAALRIYAKQMRDDLVQRGVDKVDIKGLREEELWVEVPERELRRLGLSIGDISKAIAVNSRDMPSGQMSGRVEKQLRALADAESPAALAKVEIKSFASGEKVLLGDIADIKFAYKDGSEQGLSGGKRAIQLTVQRSPTADTLATSAILDDYLAEIENVLPAGITLKKYEVRSDRLVERILLLVRNGLGGLVLVVGTLYLFLNARIAFWVAAGIPVAMLATIGFMHVSGQSINMISLFGLIMMLGVIVDDAIVVGEHTATRVTTGDGPFEAAENGANRMVTPVMAAMATTIAAFSPMFLIRDVIGQIMGVMPLVVIAVIIASLIEAFLILPGHLAHTLQPRHRRRWSYWRHLIVSFAIGTFLISIATRASPIGGVSILVAPMQTLATLKGDLPVAAYMLMIAGFSLFAGALIEFLFFLSAWLTGKFGRDADEKSAGLGQESRFRRGFDRRFNGFRNGPFRRFVGMSFDYRYVTVAIAIASILVIALGLLRGGHVQFVFFPSPESENLRARMVFNAGIDEARAVTIINEVEASLYRTVGEIAPDREPLVEAVFSTLGSAGYSIGDNLAEMRVQLTSSEMRTVRTPDIIAAWRKQLPKIPGVRRISVYSPRGGPPGRDIELLIYGNDPAVLKNVASQMTEIVAAVPGTTGTADDLPYGKPELVMELLPRGGALGFSIEEVGRQVRNAFEGAIPRRFVRGDDEITIRIKTVSRHLGTAALRNFELKSPTGQFVPLAEVVRLTERQGFSAIRRQDGKMVVAVTADLDTDIMTTERAIAILEASEMASILSRAGADYEFRGRAEERRKAFEDLGYGTVIALAVIYIILAWVFASYWRPIAIMLVIPFGLVGAILGHYLMDFKLTILSLIGLLGLAGILVNDSIILVSRMDERLESMGEHLREAAIGASCDRLRAVLLTSLTTIGGLLPLMFEKSLQAQFLLPMAITIVSGLAMATLLVLFLVPALVGIGDDIRRVLAAVFGERGPSLATD